MNENISNEELEVRKRQSPIELLFKYLSYLPLFILTIAISTTIGEIYVRYVIPKYKATTLVLVKDDKGSTKGILDDALGTKKVNIENEIELIKSKRLLRRVVAKNNFNIKYYIEGKIKMTSQFKNKTFELIVDKNNDSSETFSFVVKNTDIKGADIYFPGKITKNSKKIKHISWGEVFNYQKKDIQLVLLDSNVQL